MILFTSPVKSDKQGFYVELSIQRKGIAHIVTVDSSDYFNSVQGKNWVICDSSRHDTTHKFYVRRNVGGRQNRKTEYLHRVLCPCGEGMVPDHQDGNGLNNRQHNLVCVTRKENAMRQNHKKFRTKHSKN